MVTTTQLLHTHYIPQLTPKRARTTGYTQSGPLFHSKTRALEKHLHRTLAGVEFVYPTAPLKLHPADFPGPSSSITTTISSSLKDNGGMSKPGDGGSGPEELDAWGWWRRDDVTGLYTDLETGLNALALVLRTQGPFDGVLGFSQGAAAAVMLASLLETGRPRVFTDSAKGGGMEYPASFLAPSSAATEEENKPLIHPPLKFAIAYSGFIAPHPMYSSFYHPPIRTPALHFIGSLDSVVDEGRSLRLVEACDPTEMKEGEMVVYHPGGHFVPTQKRFLDVLVGFLRGVMAREDSATAVGVVDSSDGSSKGTTKT